jgi:pseudaminic acid cytidylyltransferase
MNIAIIPARGGSKRIPRKNIKPFLGKPIIAYSIEAALQSGLFDEVMVSTDDEEIADISKKWGAKVPFFRSEANSTDHATTADVLIEVLNNYKEQGENFSYGCCLYPTAPFIQSKHLQEAFTMLQQEEYHTVYPVVQYSYPIWRSLKVEGGRAAMFWPEHQQSRSQDLPAAYHDAGQFYWFHAERFGQDKALFTAHSGVLVLNELQVQDIDSLTDWQLAELKYQLLQTQNKGDE